MQKDIFYGSYLYEADNDVQNVKKAYQSGNIITANENINGKHVLKMFIPVLTADNGASIVDENGEPIHGYVLSLVSDYRVIQERLDSQFLNIAIVIFLITGISILIATFAMRYFHQSREKMVQVTQRDLCRRDQQHVPIDPCTAA